MPRRSGRGDTRRTLVLTAGVLALVAGCRAPSSTATVEAGGVRATHDARVPMLEEHGGALTFRHALTHEEGEGLLSLQLDGQASQGPIPALISLDGKHVTMDRAHVAEVDGRAAMLQTIVGLPGSELLTTLDPDVPAARLRLRVPAATAHLRWTFSPGRFGAAFLADGAPVADELPIAPTRTPFVVLGAATRLVLASPTGLLVQGAPHATTIEVVLAEGAPADATVSIALAADAQAALALGARLADARPTTARMTLKPTNSSGSALPARVLIEAMPEVAPPAPLVFDATREAEPTAPIVDVVGAAQTIAVPPGRYVLRATHGVGWSIARREVTVAAGQLIEIAFPLVEESPNPDYVGCDFHVHARGSFDATAVSYADRVRSLVAVGVDCAAATEHDHVGDHGPAAKELGVEARLRALQGVELTSGNPGFGHFNVYPWPAGAAVPATQGTSADALFDAVHALPRPAAADFVFQLNHPRLRTGDGASIGYLDLAGIDPKSGVATGKFVYRRDYDAIEVYNGYQLGDPDAVVRMTEEWARMLDRGEVHVATGSSDSHAISFPWAGFPRTFVEVGAGWRAAGRPVDALVAAVKKGRVFVSSGPLVALRVGDAGVGDEVAAGSSLQATVRLTSWLTRPKLRLLLGAAPLAADLVAGPAGTFTATVTMPAVERRRALIAIVEADVIGDGLAITGMTRALAITNPVWVRP